MGDTRATSGRLYADRFEIKDAAGVGGIGTVYRARDVSDGRLVALKLLHSNQTDVNARFLREAQILSELRHEGIVSYVAHGQTGEGQLYLAMEWLEGEDLSKRLKRGPLSVQESVRLLEQVADALSIAHRRGVVHRDLKPSNLFLCGNDVNRTKILDFGVARRTVATFSMTQAGMIVGTPQYMAPEQARAAFFITPAADIFSLGCVFYECLTGQPPFVAAHVAGLLSRILFDDPAPIEERRPGVASSIQSLVNHLLQKEPAQRVRDAAALRLALADLGTITEPTLPFDVTLRDSMQKSPTFADQEQSLFSIVVVNPPADADHREEALEIDATQLAEAKRQTILDSLQRLGTVPDFLANGSLIVTVPSAGTAHDQVTRAARAALLIKDHWPTAMISLATGRGILQGRNAVGEVVDRAANALAPTPQSSSAVMTSGIYLDTLSAKLLEDRFVITSRPGGALLHDEAREVDASRPLLGKPTPCVGRELELNNLEGLLDSCIEDNEAKAIVVIAAAGVGKSRLRHEFLRQLERRDKPITVLIGRGSVLHAGVAYRMIVRAILGLCDITGAESIADQRQRFRARVEKHLAANIAHRVIPLLGEMCGIPFSPDDYPVISELHQHPNVLPEQIRWAVLTWLGAECKAAPVMFVLDDLQWGDALSVGFIDEALHSLRDVPLFVLALARPEVNSVFPSLWKRHNPQGLVLRSLSKRACKRLVEQALGNRVDAATLDSIVLQSGGNALFLEELIRAAADGDSNRPMETIIAMLQARIGHLGARTRHALLAASILGSTFWDLGVAAILGLPDQVSDVNLWLDKAIDNELIEVRPNSRFVGQRELAFRHSLVYDAAHGLLSDQLRKLGHQRAADYLASTGEPIPRGLLGYHYHEAGQFDKAVQQYREAGDAAVALYLLGEAAIHYERAESAIKKFPDGPSRWRQNVELLLKQIQCSLGAAPPSATWRRIAEARELLNALDEAGVSESIDQLRRANLEYEAGKLHLYLDQNVEAEVCLERANAIARELNDEQLISGIRGMKGKRYFLEGKISKAIEMLEPLLVSQDKHREMDLDTARMHTYLALAQAQAGHGKAAEPHIKMAQVWIDKFDEVGQPRFLYGNIAIAYKYLGDLNQAMRCCQVCMDLEQKGSASVLPHLASDLAAWLHCALGDFDAALRHRRRALDLRAEHGSVLLQELFMAVHAELLIHLGQYAAAAKLAEEAANSARARGSFSALVIAERAWGVALAGTGANHDEVDAHIQTSLQLCNEVGNVMDAMQTDLDWGDIHLQRYEPVKARENFLRARARLTDEMLPCTRDFYAPRIEQYLRRCLPGEEIGFGSR